MSAVPIIFDSPGKAVNLDFRDGFLYWLCTFKGEIPTIGLHDDGIRIRSQKGSLWELTYKPLIRADEAGHYVLEADVKYEFFERSFRFGSAESALIIGVSALDKDLREVRCRFESWTFGDPGEPFFRTDVGIWSCGIIALSGKSEWKHVYSFFKPPSGTKYFKVFIKGGGAGEVYIKNLRLRRYVPESVILERKRSPFKDAPRAVIYKRIPLGDYAGKFLRIGDLNGDGKPEFIFAQNERIGAGGIYIHITCLTAIDLNGNILWQKGKPNINNYEVTSDLPVGILDINDDGKDEVICCMNFNIMILDGTTGEVLKSKPTPKSRAGGGFCEGPEILYDRILGDCIVFCDLRGLGKPRDFILKDRYNNAWAFTSDLEELWSYSGKLAHSPLVYDFDGDGRDEVFLGDALIDDNGKVLWQIEVYDHCDSAVVYRHKDKLILVIANQNGGFYFLDALTGEILKEYHLGHAQVLSIGSFDPEVKERMICAQTYWGGLNQFLFTLDGDLVFAAFGKVYGWVPVNWIGDGSELLASAHGLYDCYGNLIVRFPDSDISSKWGTKVYVWDVCNDPRDEVITWNEHYLTIYTQANRVSGKVFKPKRRLYNQTFYGNFISEPGWIEVK